MSSLNNLYVAAGCLITLGGADLGHTVDGVEVNIERSLTEVKCDIYGNTPVDYVLNGQKATVKLKLAEIVPGILNYALTEGDYDMGTADDQLHFGTKPGYSLRADALALVITPQGSNTNNEKTITFFKAVSTGNITFAYKIDEQSVYEVEFTALVDDTRVATDGRLLGRVGPIGIS